MLLYTNCKLLIVRYSNEYKTFLWSIKRAI